LSSDLGKYHITLKPGLNFIIPYIDTVAYRISTKDMPLEIGSQEAITKDNAVIVCNAIAFIKVIDPVLAVYGISNFEYAIQNLIMTTLRAIIGEMELDVALSSRDTIKARLREIISSDVVDWGISVKSVEIQDIKPSDSMIRAMEVQASAERERKAMVTKAEGTKQSEILQAEARLEAAKRDAQAQVTLAEASAEAIRRVSTAIGNQDAPMRYLLGERYLAAMGKLSESSNAKTLVLPADIQEALGGLLGKLRS